MDLKPVTEWLATAEGLSKALIAFLGVPALVWAAVTKVLDPLALPRWVTSSGAALVLLLIALLLWKSFRRHAEASRLEQPDAFTLHVTGPSSLVGRGDDLERLVKSVKNSRLVLLDGESGCGKSALVVAGLMPELRLSSSGLLPVAIRDWGDDWERGSLSAALDALFNSVTDGQREKLSWVSSPDLAADTDELARDLDARLQAIFAVLGRRPLLIADQFDDHQARHRQRFLDAEGNWLSPAALARSNQFWRVASNALGERRLHLLVVTRADTAAGLACVRFLGDDQTVSRTLPRVETEYLRPLLASIAPDDAKPAVVSNPARGWQELREQLENDLKIEGAVLMQQVRTVLLGVRQLPLLTMAAYRQAGGLHGVETMVITRALRRAGEAAGGGDAGSRVARAVLARLILSGGPNQPPKAQRASLAELHDVAGGSGRAESILAVLQREEIVRPAEGMGDAGAWQLDHDYLARAAIAEAQQSDRWSLALREGQTRYARANGWRQHWSALLPLRTLVRVCWERTRNRLRFGDAASYARISASRPAAALLVLLAVGVVANIGWKQGKEYLHAIGLAGELGTKFEPEAVLQIWREPEAVRQRIYSFVLSDKSSSTGGVRSDNQLLSRWAIAHAGLEPAKAKEAATLLRSRLLLERDPQDAARLAYVYAAVAGRLSMEDVQGEADILRAHLGRGKDGDVAAAVVSAYRAVAERISTDPALYEAVRVLGARLEQDEAMGADNVVSSAYATFAARLSETDARLEVAALRASLAKDLEGFSQAENLWKAYAVVVPRLAEADTKAELAILSAQWKTGGVELDSEWVTGYGALADHVKDAATVKACITFLRSQLMADELVPRIEREKVTPAYARLASHLIPAEAKSEAKLWRTYLGDERHRWSGGFPETAYAAVAQRLDDPAEVRAAAAALRMSLERELIAHDDPNPGNRNFRKRPYLSVPVSGEFVLAYSSVVALLDDAGVKAEANALRERLQQERKAEVLSSLVQAFKSVAVRLVETQDLKMAAAVLKARLGQETDIETAGGLALAYAKTAIAMNDAFELKSAAAILRVRLEQEAAASAAPSADAIRQRRRQLREDQPSLDGFVQAYATVAGRLPDADVKLEASALRARLEREDDGRIAGILATAYGAVAARLGEPAVQEAATYLRVHMERTAYGEITTQLAQAYAQVIGPVLARANAEAGVAITKEVLTLAGHPYLDDRSVLLALLKPAAKKNFGNDVASAVAWAQATYAIRAGNLRPPVRQETEAKGGRVPGDKPGS